MKQPKKRWARTRAQQRRDFYSSCTTSRNPPSKVWQHKRRAWKAHRQADTLGLLRVTGNQDEASVVFRYHHRHQMQWDFW